MKTKTHGWVLEDTIKAKETKNSKWYVLKNSDTSNKVFNAEVYETRREARETPNQVSTDVIRKVKIGKNGKAIKVISGR